MKRRSFVRKTVPAMAVIPLFNNSLNLFLPEPEEDEIREYLGKILYTREEVDGWFAGRLFPFSRYHSEFGWLLNDKSFRDGMNNTWSGYTYRSPDGESDIAAYLTRYFIGHYNPSGNFFCAHAVRDKVVEFPDPKPDPYRVSI
jgi:hypothetical protein